MRRNSRFALTLECGRALLLTLYKLIAIIYYITTDALHSQTMQDSRISQHIDIVETCCINYNHYLASFIVFWEAENSGLCFCRRRKWKGIFRKQKKRKKQRGSRMRRLQNPTQTIPSLIIILQLIDTVFALAGSLTVQHCAVKTAVTQYRS